MQDTDLLAFEDRSRRVVADAAVLADAWRVAGRWSDALTLLAGIEPLVHGLSAAEQALHALTTARVLTDQAGFSGVDTWTRRSSCLDAALTWAQQTENSALLGAVWNARGMSLHQRFLDTGQTTEPPEELPSFEQALGFYQATNDRRGIAQSLFHLGLVHGIVRRDHAQALPFLQQAYTLAQVLPDPILSSYAIRHIGFAQYDAHDLAAARASLLESLHLREQAGFVPGVAMAWVMLAHADAELGQRDLARAHLQHARTIFQGLHADPKVAWVDQLLRDFET